MKLSGEEYEAIVEASPNMIWRAGFDANCDYFNSTWLKFTGRAIEDEVGSGWLSGVHSDDMDTCMSTYLEAFKKRELFEMVYRLKRFDDQWRWINDRGVPAFDSSKTFVGYIGSCMDVTEKIEGQKLTDKYPAKFGVPVVATAMTFRKRKGLLWWIKTPARTIFLSDPIYAKDGMSVREAQQYFHEQVYAFMKSHAEQPDNYEYIQYVQR